MRVAIDLYSDTKTRPTCGMRKAIADAEVGDEQHFEDPTVHRLVERSAALLGHEAAVFLPSGTMANEIAILVHCRPGDELIAHADAHILNFEGGAAAALAGVMVRSLAGERGMFDGQALAKAIRPNRRHLPHSRLVSVEQTTNLGGGAVWSLDAIGGVLAAARSCGLAAHLDGARLMNAAVAAETGPDCFAAGFDSVFLDFTKGLGAPFGAILAGSAAFIDEAWRWKQRLGGSMRQAGMLAAGCLYALDHHVERLAEDHANARLLAAELADVDGLAVEQPETNMVFVDVSGTGLLAEEFSAQLAAYDLRVSVQGVTRLRAVTHLDVSRDQILLAAKAMRAVAALSRNTKGGKAS